MMTMLPNAAKPQSQDPESSRPLVGGWYTYTHSHAQHPNPHNIPTAHLYEPQLVINRGGPTLKKKFYGPAHSEHTH